MDIPPSRELRFSLPKGITPEEISGITVELTGTCGLCGSELQKVAELEWACPKEPWYRRLFKRYKHSRLVASIPVIRRNT